jgi:hypothetical protein
MERFLRVFGRARVQALLADREFVGHEGFHSLQCQSIPFRIRLKQNIRLPPRGTPPERADRCFASLKPGNLRRLPGRRLL